jgi:hypothetical protein
MSGFDEGFNPVMFMYLNPTLCVASNISSVESAQMYWNALSIEQQGTLFINIDHVPSALDPVVFLGDNRREFDIGKINADIKAALSNQGISVRGTFNVPTLFIDVDNISSNQFGRSRTTEYASITGPYGVYIGDYIKLVAKKNGATRYARVTDIDIANDTFRVCTETQFVPDGVDASYRLYGIALYDQLRLARIAYLKLFAAANVTTAYQPIPIHPTVIVNVDSNFNYELYRILYPDAQTLDKDAAYLNYLGQDDDRIKNLTDLKTVLNDSINRSFNNVTIGQTLNLNFDQESARLKWNGLELYYVTKDAKRPLPIVSPYYHGLITEYAIKKYVRDLYWPLASFCNVIAEGNVVVGGTMFAPLVCTSNLCVVENTTTATLTVKQDATIYGSLAVSDDIMGGRICIGDASQTSPPENVITDTLSVEHAFVNQSLYVGGGGATVTGAIHAHDASFSEVKGFKFGLGPSPDDYVSQLGMTPTIPSLFITSNLIASHMVAPLATISNLTVPIQLIASNIVITSGRMDVASIRSVHSWCDGIFARALSSSNLYVADFVRVDGSIVSTSLATTAVTSSNLTCSNLSCNGIGVIRSSLEVGEPVAATTDSQRATLFVHGCVRAYNLDDIADRCAMRNVQPGATGFSNLVLDAPINSYRLNHDLSRTRHGYIASDIQEIFPDAVYTTTDYKSMIMSNVAQIADNLIQLPTSMNVQVGDHIILTDGWQVPVVAANSDVAGASIVRIAAGSKLANQPVVFVEGILYNTVQCIDYHQVIMSLCAAVKHLAGR